MRLGLGPLAQRPASLDRLPREAQPAEEGSAGLPLVPGRGEVEPGVRLLGSAHVGIALQENTDRLDLDLAVLPGERRRGIGSALHAAAEEIAGERIAPVVILTAFSQRELVEKARDAGAMAYLVKPFSITDLIPAIEVAVSRFSEIAELEREVASLSDRLETRKLVERAKGLLQSKQNMSEPEAFKWIQRAAMDRRTTMKRVAEVVLETLDPPAGSSDAAPK